MSDLDHIPAASCWCNPVVLQHCPTCGGAGYKCAHCRSRSLILAKNMDDPTKLVVIHDHTRGKLVEEGKGLHMFFSDPNSGVSWNRVCEFLSDFFSGDDTCQK